MCLRFMESQWRRVLKAVREIFSLICFSLTLYTSRYWKRLCRCRRENLLKFNMKSESQVCSQLPGHVQHSSWNQTVKIKSSQTKLIKSTKWNENWIKQGSAVWSPRDHWLEKSADHRDDLRRESNLLLQLLENLSCILMNPKLETPL